MSRHWLGSRPADVEVGVPVVVVDLDEPHAPLDHPPRQQGRVGKGSGLFRLFAVERVGRGGLVGDGGQLGNARLHAERQLVLLDPGVRLGVAHELIIHLVQGPQPVQGIPAHLR